jgi:hypothetical protein
MMSLFSSCGFEQTLETALFGCLGVPLHHGWMVDRQDVELGSSIHRSSYFRLAVTLAMYESLLPEHQKYDVGCKDDMFYSALAFSSAEPEELTSCKFLQHKCSIFLEQNNICK